MKSRLGGRRRDAANDAASGGSTSPSLAASSVSDTARATAAASASSTAAFDDDDDDGKGVRKYASDKRMKMSNATDKATAALRFLVAGGLILLLVAVRTGHASRAGAAMAGLLWTRPEKVALLTVATHTTRLSEAKDSEAEYGASKTAFSYPFSVDNKARYCQLHQYDLNVDVLTTSTVAVPTSGSDSGEGSEGSEGGGGEGGEGGAGSISSGVQVGFASGGGRRSSRFRKLQLIRQLWDSYDWLIWMDIDALFLDPAVDVLELIDKKADLHFTLESAGTASAEQGGQPLYRVNTGFFVVHTTPLARDFIERAWAINDCGRGESDQRSMNFVLGRVNSDDESCSAEGAAAEWASLLARHGGAKFAADKFKFYDKSLLNAFPKDVSAGPGGFVPVDRYALPSAPGDETPSSVVVHFAGQYGGARSLDGKLPVGMLVQYLKLLSSYHGQFLDRLQRKAVGDKLKKEGGAQHNPFGRGGRHRRERHEHGAIVGSGSGSSGSSLRGGRHGGGGSRQRHVAGPMTVQDSVANSAADWTRSIRDARQRLHDLEGTLEGECLGLVREHYVDKLDSDTGIRYKEPPKMLPPPGTPLTERHLFLDSYGNARLDPDRTCDYVAVLSRARQHLGRLLPPSRGGVRPKNFYDHYDDAMGGMHARWPRALLCAAPNNDFELVGRLNASRLWLEMRKPSALSQLAMGGSFEHFESSEVGSGDGGDDLYAMSGLLGEDSNLFGIKGHGGEKLFAHDLGPSLYDKIDVSAPEEPFDERHDTSHANSLAAQEAADADALKLGGAPANALLVAVAECAFLDPGDGTVFEGTFAYSAAQDVGVGGSGGGRGGAGARNSRVRAPAHLLALQEAPKKLPHQNQRFASKLLKTIGVQGAGKVGAGKPPQIHHHGKGGGVSGIGGGKEGTQVSSNSDHVRRLPGAVFLPPMPHHVGKALAAALDATGSMFSQRGFGGEGGLLFQQPNAPAPATASEFVGFWTYTAPLLLLLLEELPEHVAVVLPPQAASAAHRKQLARAIGVLHLPTHRIIVSADASSPSTLPAVPPPSSSSSLKKHKSSSSAVSKLGQSAEDRLRAARRPPEELPAGHVVYADTLLSVHATTSLATLSLNSLHRLRSAVDRGVTHADPFDDLVIIIEETPLDMPLPPSPSSSLASSFSSPSSLPSAGAAAPPPSSGRALVADWYEVQVALQNALPGDQVVTFGNGFRPDDATAVELFKRAKLVVVSAGVVPSLLLTMFSSEGVPVIELVGRGASAGATAHKANEPPVEASGIHLGWEWTRLVAGGFGLNRFTVRAAASLGPMNGDVFRAEDIAEAATNAMNPPAEPELGDDREPEDDREEGNGGGDAGADAPSDVESLKNEIDDTFKHITPQHMSSVDSSVAGGGGDGNSHGEGAAEEVRALLREFVENREGFKASPGLRDRDRFGDFLQRLFESEPYLRTESEFRHRGAAVGAEYGDFSLQVLKGWHNCKKWWVVDRFESGVGGASEDASEPANSLLAMDSDKQSERLGMVKTNLEQWFKGDVAELIRRAAPLSPPLNIGAGVGVGEGVLEDGSLDFVYLDEEHSYAAVSKQLLSYWRKLAPGGVIAGHDFTRANAGVAEAVVHFAETTGRRLFLTGVQTPRADVMGKQIPPCCPSWYLVKGGAVGPGGQAAQDMEAAAAAVSDAMNAETVVQGTVVARAS